MKNLGFVCLGMGIDAAVLAVLLELGWMTEIKEPTQQALVATGAFIVASASFLLAGRRRPVQRLNQEKDVLALEKKMIEQALVENGWNKVKVARQLGVSRTTVIRKIQELGIKLPLPKK